MQRLTKESRIQLNDGNAMPMLGYGTWQIPDGEEVRNLVLTAIEAGYRLIDTAKIYENERGVGEAIRAAVAKGVARNELFVTTKLWNDDHDNVEQAFNASLERLGLEYIDLYLIHWPVTGKRIATWKKFEKLIAGGKVKSIGVSNFTLNQLKELLDKTSIVPAVNQVEFSPWLFQKDLLEFCRKHHIAIEAYSPLTRGRKLNDPTLVEIATHYNKSPAQILIRWCLQHNVVVIPKSLDPQKIRMNADVFDFTINIDDMATLDSLNENLRYCWNPEELD